MEFQFIFGAVEFWFAETGLLIEVFIPFVGRLGNLVIRVSGS